MIQRPKSSYTMTSELLLPKAIASVLRDPQVLQPAFTCWRLLTFYFPSDTELNAHLPERFRGAARPNNRVTSTTTSNVSDVKLNVDIRKYVQRAEAVADTSSTGWLSQTEVPASGEVLMLNDDDVDVRPNKVNGPWKTKERYLSTHYTLLREDAVAPLREAVDEFRKNPDMMEGDNKAVNIYVKVGRHLRLSLLRLTCRQVHIAGFTFASLGVAARIRFSTSRVGKGIPWKYSKRLLAGTMVALSPAKDKFQSKCIIALVAARPIAGVEDSPPQIDIYFSRTEEIEIDPQREWIMLEAKTGYYEAARHTLKALQKLGTERFVSCPTSNT